ncbi:AMP-binding protein [Bacillus taeanensis]|uniref:2-acyl-glycerophospho-ethanolamine acyltransferase n=1 Tax=Bacillus taeanensis TaxID=273032 RepID=A0A366Y234_9BACI|nr:AMP-binding protein [Bacillus taeanensis]RBW71049.1 2-acyl-glycerophospho-ethanolamine acyltransferase [Bacillus taeanensis]
MLSFLNKLRTKKIAPSSAQERVIFMSNHLSMMDLSLLDAALPKKVHFVVFNKREYELNEKNLKNRKVTAFDQLDASSLMKTVNLIEDGEDILLFPENRISKAGNLMRIYPEIAYIAYRTKAVIYPIYINKELKEHGAKLRLESFVSGTPSISLGSSFSLSQFESAKGEEQKERLAQVIYKKMGNHQLECQLKRNVNLFDEFLKADKSYRDRDFIIKDLSGQISYNKFLLSVQVISQKVEQMINEERIGILLPNSIGHSLLLFACFKNGITPAILNFTMGEQNLLDCCETSGLKTIVTSKQFIQKAGLQELLKSLSDNYRIIYLEDVKEQISTTDKLTGLKNNTLSPKSEAKSNEIILFTSGSESKPKGVILTHHNLFANIKQALTVIDLNSKDYLFNPLPMFHSYGLTIGTILPLISNIPVFLHPSPVQYKAIPELIYQEDATALLSTPTFLNGYGRNAHPFMFHSLRYVITGAEKAKEELKQTWQEKFGIRILEGYGATEGAPVLALNTPLYNKPGSVGQLLPGIQYHIQPVEGIPKGGTLQIKGPNLMKGYLIHGKGFIPLEDWYDTGDVVEVDEFEFVTITSRLKRFAKVGGEMVSLNLVESLAGELYGHNDFAAVAVSDKRKGERIILFTTDKETNDRVLKKHIKMKKVSTLLVPASIEHIDEIPLLGSGKTDYVTLEKLAGGN